MTRWLIMFLVISCLCGIGFSALLIPLDEEKEFFLGGGVYEFRLNATTKSVVSIQSNENFDVNVFFTLNNIAYQSKNFTYDRFLVNVIGDNGTYINYNNITVNRTFSLRITNPSTLTIFLTEIMDVFTAVESAVIRGKRNQVFQYHYIQEADRLGLKSNALRIDCTSYSAYDFLGVQIYSNGVTPYGGSVNNPSGKYFGGTFFYVEPLFTRTASQEMDNIREMDIFFDVIVQNENLNRGMYSISVYPYFSFPFINFLYIFLLCFSILFLLFISIFALFRICSNFCERGMNRNQDIDGARHGFPGIIFHDGLLNRINIQQDEDGSTKVILPQPDAKEYALRRELLTENDICCVCLDYKKIVKFQPCEHICTCEFCSLAVVNSSGLCPLCRSKIESHEIQEDLRLIYPPKKNEQQQHVNNKDISETRVMDFELSENPPPPTQSTPISTVNTSHDNDEQKQNDDEEGGLILESKLEDKIQGENENQIENEGISKTSESSSIKVKDIVDEANNEAKTIDIPKKETKDDVE